MKTISSLLLFCVFLIAPAGQAFGQITGLSNWTLYIDPGHSQTQNQGTYGYSEAEKVLRVGLRLKEMLQSTTDIGAVYMSRTNDQQSVGLSERSDDANSKGASWYHSIHSNAGGSSSTATLILWGQNGNNTEKVPNGGKAMSDQMIGPLTDYYRYSTIGSRGDCSFYGTCSSGSGPYLSVNRRTSMPSELSEGSFHTNARQNRRNMNADWKRLEAYAFYVGILKYHGKTPPDNYIGTGYVTDKELGTTLNGVQITLNDSIYVTDTYESLFHKWSDEEDGLSNGFFWFDDMSAGELTITATAPGYEEYTGTVNLNSTDLTFIDFSMVSNVDPTVISSLPAEADTTQKVNEDIEISFSRPMDQASVEAGFTITPAIEGSFSWQDNGKKMVFNPADTLNSLTNYIVTVDTTAHSKEGIYYLEANADSVWQLTFKTLFPDATPPRIFQARPSPNSREANIQPVITILYTEPLAEETVTEDKFELRIASGGPLIPSDLKMYVVDEISYVTLFPIILLAPDTQYEVTAAAGIEDLFQNASEGEQSFRFTTGDVGIIETPIDRFESGVFDNWFQPSSSGSTAGIDSDSTEMFLDTEHVNLLTGSSNAMAIKYGWDDGAGSWLIREYLNTGAPRNVQFTSDKTLQVYVFGDGSENKFRFALDDRVPTSAGGNHEVSEWYVIDWTGWKLVSWDLANDPVGSWIGDGVLNGKLRIDSFQLTHVEGASLFGTIYFDDLRVVETTLASPIEENFDQETPAEFALEQNYPNPFNPVTTIAFSLPASQHVSLVVYDLLGREVVRLLDETMSAGRQTIQFNAESLPSGTYFYRLTSENGIQTKKLVLLK